MTLEIRRIRDDEIQAFVEARTTAFLERLDVEKIAEEERPDLDLDRTWAAFDGDRVRGTFRSWATELTVPGGAFLPAAAIANVAVVPTHRRQGVLRAMVAAEHAAIRDRGEVIGMLYASEYPIYGRFGYGAACQEGTWTLDARSATFHDVPTGTIELTKPGPEARDGMRAVFEAWRLRQPGEIRRLDSDWDYDLGLRDSAWGPTWKGFLAIHRDGSGDLDGYARYSVADDKWDQRQPRNVLKLDEMHALSDEAAVALWRYLTDIDWVASIRAPRRSPGDRLPWFLTNARDAGLSESGDGLWVRLLDVPRALAARTYEREAKVVLEVVDPESSGGRTRIQLDAGPDGATCQETDRSPDLTLDVAALGAAYLGGTRLRDAVVPTGVDEHRDGALREADRLFRTADEPWCSTFF